MPRGDFLLFKAGYNPLISACSGGSDGKEHACTAGDPGLIPGLGRREWQKKREWQPNPTPEFLPGESPWTEEAGGLQSMGSQRVRYNWRTNTQPSDLRSLLPVTFHLNTFLWLSIWAFQNLTLSTFFPISFHYDFSHHLYTLNNSVPCSPANTCLSGRQEVFCSHTQLTGHILYSGWNFKKEIWEYFSKSLKKISVSYYQEFHF